MNWAVERYADGFIVADYSGKRGRFGAAYAGRDGVWHNQPTTDEPFTDKKSAEEFAAQNVK